MRYRKHIVMAVVVIMLSACGSSKKAVEKEEYDAKAEAIIKSGSKKTKDVRKALVAEAEKWKGVRYKSGGEGKNGVDCSGFVMKVYEKVTGYKLPRNSAAQQRACKSINKKELKAGDLVFFNIGSKRVNHVAMYIGDGNIIHASGSRGVVVDDLSGKYFVKHYNSSGMVEAVLGKKTSKKEKQKSESSKQRRNTDKLRHDAEQNELDLDKVLNQKLDSIYK